MSNVVRWFALLGGIISILLLATVYIELSVDVNKIP